MKFNFSEKLIELNQAHLDSVDSKNEEEIFKIYTLTAVRMLGADYGWVWRSVSGQDFELSYKTPDLPYQPAQPRDFGTNYFVRDTGRTMLVEDVRQSRYIRQDAREHMASVAIMPLIFKNIYYGNIVVCFKNRHVFTETDDDLCYLISTSLPRSVTIHRLNRDLKDFKNTLDVTLDTIVIFDHSGQKIEYFNKGLHKLLGVKQEEILGKDIFEVLPSSAEPNFRAAIAVLNRKEREALFFETDFEPNKKIVKEAEVFLQLVESHPKNKKFLCIIHDITRRKKFQRQIEDLLRQKDEFLAVASHELKTSVTIIKGFTQLLQAQLDGHDASVDHHLSKVEWQANKLSRLIEDLLDMTKIDAGQMKYEKQVFGLHNLLEEVVEDMQFVSATHKLRFDSETRAKVRADRDRLAQVFMNVINNAIRYAPPASEVTIKLTSTDEHALVTITDQGPGIPKEYQDQIFKRFFKSGTGSGLGLGLYISREIMQYHAGEIWVESEPGTGSTFFIRIPLSYDRKN